MASYQATHFGRQHVVSREGLHFHLSFHEYKLLFLDCCHCQVFVFFWGCRATVPAHVADLMMTSSIRHVAKNICHRLHTDCSPAFQGNELHLSTSTDHLSRFGFSGLQAWNARRSAEPLGLSHCDQADQCSGCFNVVWCELLARETFLNLCIVITAWEQELKPFAFSTYTQRGNIKHE